MVVLLYSHAALASSVLASPDRMSYLSKSKWTSFSSIVARKVPGCGRAVDDTARLTALFPLGLLVLLTVPPLLPAPVPLKVAAPPGAGAEAIDVAGRFAQPGAARVSSNKDITKNRVVIAFLQSVPSVALDGPWLVPASAAEGLAPAPGPRSSVLPSSTARASAIPPRPPDAASPILLADRRRH